MHYPTPGSKAITAADEAFKKNYAQTKEPILSLHKDSIEVQTWYVLGGGANDLRS